MLGQPFRNFVVQVAWDAVGVWMGTAMHSLSRAVVVLALVVRAVGETRRRPASWAGGQCCSRRGKALWTLPFVLSGGSV